jgi:hypothetical protein
LTSLLSSLLLSIRDQNAAPSYPIREKLTFHLLMNRLPTFPLIWDKMTLLTIRLSTVPFLLDKMLTCAFLLITMPPFPLLLDKMLTSASYWTEY